MLTFADLPAGSTTLVVALGAAVLLVTILLRIAAATFIYIPNTHYGVVERIWSERRSPEPFGPLALAGNPGFLPEVIAAAGTS